MSEMFDRLAKMAAGGVSRRDALKGLAGLLAGGFLAALPGKSRADDEGGGSGSNDDEINERCQTFCKPCLGKKGGVFGHCIDSCKSALRKNSKATLCGTCSKPTFCSGKTPHCCAAGVCCATTCCGGTVTGTGTCCTSSQTCKSGMCTSSSS